MAYNQKGYTPYKSGGFSQPGKSPYKFLGKLIKGVGGALGGAVGGISKLLGGGGGGQSIKMTPDMMKQGGMFGLPGMLAGGGGRGGFGFMKKEKSYSPYTKPSSPLKTDAILVKGAKDMYTGYGTVKYGNIAPARAYTDMVNTVEKTVNRSSKAQLAKDRRRAKRTTKSYDKYADWLEKYDRREHERDRHKQKRRAARDKWRDNLGKPPTYYADYTGTTHGHGVTQAQDHGLYDGWGSGGGGYSGMTKKEGRGYSPYTQPSTTAKKALKRGANIGAVEGIRDKDVNPVKGNVKKFLGKGYKRDIRPYAHEFTHTFGGVKKVNNKKK